MQIAQNSVVSIHYTLTNDGGDVIERYDAWVEKTLYGRNYMGIDRSTYLIDGEGVLRGLWRKVRVKNHADEVLKAAQALA